MQQGPSGILNSDILITPQPFPFPNQIMTSSAVENDAESAVAVSKIFQVRTLSYLVRLLDGENVWGAVQR